MYSAYTLGKQVIKGPFTAVLAAAGFALVAFLDVNAVLVILAGAFAGCMYSMVKARRTGRTALEAGSRDADKHSDVNDVPDTDDSECEKEDE